MEPYQDRQIDATSDSGRKEYKEPQLRVYGNLHEITLSNSVSSASDSPDAKKHGTR